MNSGKSDRRNESNGSQMKSSSSRNIKFVFVMCLAVFLTSCQQEPSASDEAFESIFPEINMNEEISLRYMRNLSATNIELQIKNTADREISFANDLGLEVFTLSTDENRWVKIQTLRESYGDGIKLRPKGDILSSYPIEIDLDYLVFPFEPDLANPESIRVVVVGLIIGENGNEKYVGGYTDLSIDVGEGIAKKDAEIIAEPRDFRVSDLLLTNDDLPEGWQTVEEPSDITTTIVSAWSQYTPSIQEHLLEVVEIGFRSGAPEPMEQDTFTVFRFRSAYSASYYYRLMTTDRGALLPDWIDDRYTADETNLSCSIALTNTGQYCIWTARYEEFIIVFAGNLNPDYLPKDEFAKIVKSGDENLAIKLNK